jgi:hypothetical protein
MGLDEHLPVTIIIQQIKLVKKNMNRKQTGPLTALLFVPIHSDYARPGWRKNNRYSIIPLDKS